ncbi:hypothetical protein K1719_011015 [Acacia pycnantha]|nr:hypothetical protein K1719_011015 [Acacia pycnantha]
MHKSKSEKIKDGTPSEIKKEATKNRAEAPTFKMHNERQAKDDARETSCKEELDIKAEVKYVNAEEAKELIAVEGYTILDVKDKTQFDRAHITSCYHVPLFVENKDNDPGTIIKRTQHNNFSGLFFGLPFTKLNAAFVQSVKSQVSPESKLLVVCQEGLSVGR